MNAGDQDAEIVEIEMPKASRGIGKGVPSPADEGSGKAS